MKNGKTILGILLVFILGAAAGALVTHIVYKSRMESLVSGSPGARQEMLVKRLTHKLDLDDRQRDQVRAIVRATEAEIKGVRRQFRPQIEAILEKSQARIREILRPEQQEQFEKIIAKRKTRWNRRE